MNKAIYIPAKKSLLIMGLAALIFGLFMTNQLINGIQEKSWQEELYKPGIIGKLVIIDPGHGGADPGAIQGMVREADLNLQVARQLKKELEALGAEAILTREKEGPLVPETKMNYAQWSDNLKARRDFAVGNKGHIFISLHTNTNQSSKASGAMVYYTGVNDYNPLLAEKVQNRLNAVWSDKKEIREKGFSVILFEDMPSALVEMGFMTNKRDMQVLSSSAGRKKIAKAISMGIKDYCDILPRKTEEN